jgi:hypothetical protein
MVSGNAVGWDGLVGERSYHCGLLPPEHAYVATLPLSHLPPAIAPSLHIVLPGLLPIWHFPRATSGLRGVSVGFDHFMTEGLRGLMRLHWRGVVTTGP